MTTDQDNYRDWLRRQLAAKGHGSKKALAQHLGFTTPDPITRMLNQEPGKETREISAVEIARMAEFFDAPLPTLPLDGPHNKARRLEEATAIWDRLSDAERKQFLAYALGIPEPAQTGQAGQVPPRSSEK